MSSADASEVKNYVWKLTLLQLLHYGEGPVKLAEASKDNKTFVHAVVKALRTLAEKDYPQLVN